MGLNEFLESKRVSLVIENVAPLLLVAELGSANNLQKTEYIVVVILRQPPI